MRRCITHEHQGMYLKVIQKLLAYFNSPTQLLYFEWAIPFYQQSFQSWSLLYASVNHVLFEYDFNSTSNYGVVEFPDASANFPTFEIPYENAVSFNDAFYVYFMTRTIWNKTIFCWSDPTENLYSNLRAFHKLTYENHCKQRRCTQTMQQVIFYLSSFVNKESSIIRSFPTSGSILRIGHLFSELS